MFSGEIHVGDQIFSPLAPKMKPGEFFKHSCLKLISVIAQNPVLTNCSLQKSLLLLYFSILLLEKFRLPQIPYFSLKSVGIFRKKNLGAEPHQFFAAGVAARAHFWRFSAGPKLNEIRISDFTMMISGENHVGTQIFSTMTLKMKPGDFFKRFAPYAN